MHTVLTMPTLASHRDPLRIALNAAWFITSLQPYGTRTV
jgi:hypothetical protein